MIGRTGHQRGSTTPVLDSKQPDSDKRRRRRSVETPAKKPQLGSCQNSKNMVFHSAERRQRQFHFGRAFCNGAALNLAARRAPLPLRFSGEERLNEVCQEEAGKQAACREQQLYSTAAAWQEINAAPHRLHVGSLQTGPLPECRAPPRKTPRRARSTGSSVPVCGAAVRRYATRRQF